jgi:hypothetical protein
MDEGNAGEKAVRSSSSSSSPEKRHDEKKKDQFRDSIGSNKYLNNTGDEV